MSHIDFCWHFWPDIEKFYLECPVIKMHKWFNRCWIESAHFFCSLSHAGLAARTAIGRLYSRVRIAWGYTVKWQSCLKNELQRKKKKNRNRLRVIMWRRKEWVRQREGVKVLQWRLEARWHLQPLKAPFRNAVINSRSRHWNAEIKEKINIRKPLISHLFVPLPVIYPTIWIRQTHFTFNQLLFAALLQTGHGRLVSHVDRSQILKAPLSQTV